ncbi:MAG: hypothetical protein RBR29_11255, partial [Castellaniella sp.]|uniref:hypothetical protein n=1 Tax=Castellaniella sp. TaxID=1955812 RepID=UPI002A360BED
MPLPKQPTRLGDTVVETPIPTTPPETGAARAVPGPALDRSLDAPRTRTAKTRPVAAILSKSTGSASTPATQAASSAT